MSKYTLQDFVYVSEAIVPDDFDLKEVIVEGANGKEKRVIFEGLFSEIETKNQNKRFYPEEIQIREHERLNAKIKNGGLLMELDHPIIIAESQKDIMRAQKVLLEKAAGIITTPFQFKGKNVVNRVEILTEDPLGLKVYNFSKKGWKPGVSSRAIGGRGTFDSSSGLTVVPDNIRYVTYDFVENPSFHNAKLNEIITEEFEFFKHQYKMNKTQKVWQVMFDISEKIKN